LNPPTIYNDKETHVRAVLIKLKPGVSRDYPRVAEWRAGFMAL
jgi:hypothetical protein